MYFDKICFLYIIIYQHVRLVKTTQCCSWYSKCSVWS